MKGEIFERAKHVVLNINEHTVKTAWEILNDGLAIEIAWEALNLLELYIILRIMEYMLQVVEYLLLDIRTSSIDLIEQISVPGMKKLDWLLENGKSQTWLIFRIYHMLEAEINVLKSRIADSKNHMSLNADFIMKPDRTSTYPSVSHVIGSLSHSYCC
jgi:hypothetical protein